MIVESSTRLSQSLLVLKVCGQANRYSEAILVDVVIFSVEFSAGLVVSASSVTRWIFEVTVSWCGGTGHSLSTRCARNVAAFIEATDFQSSRSCVLAASPADFE